MKNPLGLLRLCNVSIYQQLQLEEALLRLDKGNWLIWNEGSSIPAIVLGISGKVPELVHVDKALQSGVAVIKRFTGGGTVVVDEDTLFCSLIMQAESVPNLDAFPRPIMQWTEGLYHKVFGPFGNFKLRENDYVFGEHKFGGNAQAITRQRWLHHTSFLWDYKDHMMELLKHPNRIPEYRQDRHHHDFVMRLRDQVPDSGLLLPMLVDALSQHNFDIQERHLSDVLPLLQRPHLQSTKLLTTQELAEFTES